MSGRLGALEHPPAPQNSDERLAELQERLARLQVAYRRQKRSAIILLEGWDAAGKGGMIRRLSAPLDPRYFEVVPISAPDALEREQHYLTRFWGKFPAAGNWTIFDRSWYGRVLVERVEGFATPAAWERAFGEINALEAMQVAHGTRVVKLFLHVSQQEQDERLVERLEKPWKRWKVNADDFRNRAKRNAYLDAMDAMFERTDTPDAPWHLIGADHKKHARVAGLQIIADALSEGVDLADPPLDPDLRKLAERELGRKIEPA